MKPKLKCLFLNVFVFAIARSDSELSGTVFDMDLYESVLDLEQCRQQIAFISSNATLMMKFTDASFRTPRSIMKGNTRDLGNYFQCLDISEDLRNMTIQGKYCLVNFPLNQESFQLRSSMQLPSPKNPYVDSLSALPWEQLDIRDSMLNIMSNYENAVSGQQELIEDPQSTNLSSSSEEIEFELAICIPKTCTVNQALDFFTNNWSAMLEFSEQYCRLPNDKAWTTAESVAILIFSLIAFLTILSSAYDIRHTTFLHKDPKDANDILKSFSIVTNTKNFFIFPSGTRVVTCLDGFRAIATAGIILGHTFDSQNAHIPENMIDVIQGLPEFKSLWITNCSLNVDTFWMISGLLVVYTTSAKYSRSSLFKSLHIFCLSRHLRLFPVLAFTVLMVTSFLHRMADGPFFLVVEELVNNCRRNWWSTLLYVQNFVHPANMCLTHSWYLAVDMQLYILSPLVLFWVLDRRKQTAFLALASALLIVISAASVYNYLNKFMSSEFSFTQTEDSWAYSEGYYLHTLPRAAPFFVGMVFGNLFHVYRARKPRIPTVLMCFLWCLAVAISTVTLVATYWVLQPGWNNRLVDNIFNSFRRPVWAACVGWMALACHTGYGGPINWFLSLHVFKILSRLSYAMYLIHSPLIDLVYATSLAPVYFSLQSTLIRFATCYTLTFISAFVVTITIDFPFANLVKINLRRAMKTPPTENESFPKNFNTEREMTEDNLILPISEPESSWELLKTSRNLYLDDTKDADTYI